MARKSRKHIETAVIAPQVAKKWNVGAYVRLSAVDKKQKGDSIENQQAIIAAYCDEHLGADGLPELVIREVYIDNGLSGQSFERPAFQRMLADMENGLINCCVSKDLSRYGRSAIDTGYYIEKYFPARGIRCIAINDNYDSADARSGAGASCSSVMVNLKNLVNESYALEIGRKIHTTKQMNIRNGCFVGATPPYGYLKSAENNHKLVPDPIAAPIVTKMFEMAANGIITSEIHKWLTENNILPPMKHLHSIGVASGIKRGDTPHPGAQGSEHWNISVVYSILKNRIYTGDMVQGKGRTQSYKATQTPKSDWIITPNTHEPLVTRDVFDEAQKLFSGKKAPRTSTASENIFRGKIFCGHCGHAMVRSKTGKNSYTIKCDTRYRYGKGDCIQVSINEDKMKGILLEIIQQKAEVYCGQDKSTAEAIREPVELAAVSTELIRVSDFLKGLYESLVAGDITQTEYHYMKQSYETQIATLTERERHLRETARERYLKQVVTAKAREQLGVVNYVTDINAAVIDALIDKIVVFEDKRIEVRFKFTDEISEGSAE